MPTLLHYLTQVNPTLHVTPGKGYGGTTNPNYPVPSRVLPWTEFNENTLLKLFDNKLSTTLEESHHDLGELPDLHHSDYFISSEKHLQRTLTKYNNHIVLKALGKSSGTLLAQDVQMVTGGKNTIIEWPALEPDWVGKCDVYGEYTILPGDSKVSEVFRSEDLDQYLEPDGEWTGSVTGPSAWPVRQLLAYCIRSYMRYGYIITDKELFVIRVSSDFESDERPDEEELSKYSLVELGQAIFEGPCIECTTIPWERDGKSNILTVNLALVILHILAANNPLIHYKKYPSLAEEKLIDPKHQPTLDEAMKVDAVRELQARQGTQSDDPAAERELRSQLHADPEQRNTRNQRRSGKRKQLNQHKTRTNSKTVPRVRYRESSSSSSLTSADPGDTYVLSQPGTATISFSSTFSTVSTQSYEPKNRYDTRAAHKSQKVDKPQSVIRRPLKGVFPRPRSSSNVSSN